MNMSALTLTFLSLSVWEDLLLHQMHFSQPFPALRHFHLYLCSETTPVSIPKTRQPVKGWTRRSPAESWVKLKFHEQFPALEAFCLTGDDEKSGPRPEFVQDLLTHWVGEHDGVKFYWNEYGRSDLLTIFTSFTQLKNLEVGEISLHSTHDKSKKEDGENKQSNCIWDYGGKLKSLEFTVNLSLNCYKENILYLDSIITGFPLSTLNQSQSNLELTSELPDLDLDEKERVSPSILNLTGNSHSSFVNLS